MSETKINEKIMEKLKKFSMDPTELKMSEQLLLKELQWFDSEDPPFKQIYAQLLDKFFPFKEEQ